MVSRISSIRLCVLLLRISFSLSERAWFLSTASPACTIFKAKDRSPRERNVSKTIIAASLPQRGPPANSARDIEQTLAGTRESAAAGPHPIAYEQERSKAWFTGRNRLGCASLRSPSERYAPANMQYVDRTA
jgi:hypothetical protein